MSSVVARSLVDRSLPAKVAYPDDLLMAEHEAWGKCTRRRVSIPGKERSDLGKDAKGPTVGFALSGGGIRSATFCLGVFQALAKGKLLERIDYVSSVSGGSFFAAFYGRMFSRAEIGGFDEINQILSPNAREILESQETNSNGSHVQVPWQAHIFRWLRENGRYLAPNGSGDLLVGITVFLRNWLTVQILLAVTALSVFLAAQLPNAWLPQLSGELGGRNLYLCLTGILALFLLAPLGWAYWTFSMPDAGMLSSADSKPAAKASSRFRWRFVWHGLRTLGALAVLIVMILPFVPTSESMRGAIAAVLVWTVTAFCWQLAMVRSSRTPGAWVLFVAPFVLIVGLAIVLVYYKLAVYLALALLGGALIMIEFITLNLWPAFGLPKDPSDLANFSEVSRSKLTQWLRSVLVLTAGLLVFALVDIAGEWALTWHRQTLVHGVSALYGVFAAIVPFAQSALTWLKPKVKGARFSLPLSALAGIGAIIVVVPALITLAALSHAIADPPRAFAPTAIDTPVKRAHEFGTKRQGSALVAKLAADPPSPNNQGLAWLHSILDPGARRTTCILILAIVFLLLTSGFSRSWTSWVFLNRSGLHALYCARLIRAYLGASNRRRYDDSAGVSDPVDGDDIAQEDYWRPKGDKFWQKGPPLHLVNMTINETLDGRTQTETRDRKGVGMAIGPAGFSVGIRHHAVIGLDTNGQAKRTEDGTGFKACIFPSADQTFSVFDTIEEPRTFRGQTLSLGNWTAISGAAVSTGLGQLGSIGTSVLTGFFNLRLGYWWNSGTRSIAAGEVGSGGRPTERKTNSEKPRAANPSDTANTAAEDSAWQSPQSADASSARSASPQHRVPFVRKLGKWFTAAFPVQSSLIDEFLGRFHGTMRRYWNLTDGGHFENLGAYELIRRRLPLIVVIDAAADPEYEFADLANLIRKARLDFNAEIDFLEPKKEGEQGPDKFAEACKHVNDYLLAGSLNKGLKDNLLGTLDQLRRGEWAAEPLEDPNRPPFFKSTDLSRLSRGHAAIAKITYLDEHQDKTKGERYLLLIKPTLTGDEPQDLLNYHSAYPDFPHQTTANQFFDEAQWESYRRLGQHITERLFQIPD